MDYFLVEMGEGIAGNYTKVAAATTTIYSCMGIAFLNDFRRIGGLYHYPSCDLEKPYVKPTLVSMYNQIQPQRIILTPASIDHGFMIGGSSKEDTCDVFSFLKNLSSHPTMKSSVSLAKGTYSANYWWDGKQIRLNENFSEDPTRNGLSAFEDIYDPQARAISHDVRYYGFNKEKNINGPKIVQGVTW